MTRRQRTLLFAASFCVLAGFALALSVKPDPRGFGTHQQFGLPPCTFKLMFGIPCPSCGGTTCVAHYVRGQWLHALQANAAVFCLALGTTLFVPWSWLSCWRGKTICVSAPSQALLWGLMFLSAVALAQWFVRLLSL